jgi:hypothetical protein
MGRDILEQPAVSNLRSEVSVILKMKSADSSMMLVNINQTAWNHIPEDLYLLLRLSIIAVMFKLYD